MAYTLTFGDVAENHVGMQQIGKLSDKGYSKEDLLVFKEKFEKLNLLCEIKEIKCQSSDVGYLLIVKNISNANKLLEEQKKLDYDKKAYMYGRVVNKLARYNLCFSEFEQEPNYEEGMGRIYAFKDLPYLNNLRNLLFDITGDLLQAEGNYYYNVNKCGIGYHGDTERRKVIGIRLGQKHPLCYAWYKNSERCSEVTKIDLEHGDLYIMEQKATGFDWKKKSIYTLRHAAGCGKYVN